MLMKLWAFERDTLSLFIPTDSLDPMPDIIITLGGHLTHRHLTLLTDLWDQLVLSDSMKLYILLYAGLLFVVIIPHCRILGSLILLSALILFGYLAVRSQFWSWVCQTLVWFVGQSHSQCCGYEGISGIWLINLVARLEGFKTRRRA